MNELERKALAMMGKQQKRKPRSRTPQRGINFRRKGVVKQQQMLEELEDGAKIYTSTVDVEMSKWRFKEATGRKLELIPTEYERIYIMKLV